MSAPNAHRNAKLCAKGDHAWCETGPADAPYEVCDDCGIRKDSAVAPARSAKRATRIDSATNGLSVTVGDDGAWVEFTTQTGKHFCFQPAQEFCGRGGIGSDAVRDWCLEMQARRTAPKPEDSTLGAAPDLLAALRAVVADSDAFDDESSLFCVRPATIGIARAAIAKATGAV